MNKNPNIVLTGVAATAITILTISGCAIESSDAPNYDYTSVCQTADYVRVEDAACDRNDGGSFVMFISTGSDYHVPPTGQRIDQSRVVKTVPAGKTVQKAGVPNTGGVVKNSPNIQRGGFGVSGGSKSGGS